MRVGSAAACVALCLGAALLGGAGCAKAPGADERPNVVLVLVDTLRADHLSSYGYSRQTSPNLDAFARDALRFEDARSQTACTASSMASFLTSRYPIDIEREPGHIGIPAGVPTLAEVLAENGYATSAVSASQIVRRSPSRRNAFGEFDRGFERFHEACAPKNPTLPESHASCVNRAAFEAIDAAARPFFLYLHYLDPHSPYSPPRDFSRPFSDSGRFELDRALREGRPPLLHKQTRDAGRPIQPEQLQHLVDLYDDEIAYFDARFGELLAGLREREVLDRTIVIFASDHGEAFLERGYLGHCLTPLFDAMTRTPLILRIPGVERTGAVTAQAQNVDIMPTVLDYLGISFEQLGLDGRSLRPIVERDEEVNRYTFSVQGEVITLSDRDFTLTRHIARDKQALYARRADPSFQQDLSERHPEHARRMAEALSEWFAAGETDAQGGYLEGARDLDAQLRALGYLE